jgi:phosphopantothenoylcysteine synthetase/decarboxylase
VGFALETGDGLRRAEAKLRQKGADYVVLNDASALGADRPRSTSSAATARAGASSAGTKRSVAPRARAPPPRRGRARG